MDDRTEWIEERIAIMTESGMPEHEAVKIAEELWAKWESERKS